MKVKVSELQGTALDWAVAKCENIETKNYSGNLIIRYEGDGWQPSADWAQAGPIIRENLICISPFAGGGWVANSYMDGEKYIGNTPTIAAMRCFVASRVGDEIEIPEELK